MRRPIDMRPVRKAVIRALEQECKNTRIPATDKGMAFCASIVEDQLKIASQRLGVELLPHHNGVERSDWTARMWRDMGWPLPGSLLDQDQLWCRKIEVKPNIRIGGYLDIQVDAGTDSCWLPPGKSPGVAIKLPVNFTIKTEV